jgi:hypothetical protein
MKSHRLCFNTQRITNFQMRVIRVPYHWQIFFTETNMRRKYGIATTNPLLKVYLISCVSLCVWRAKKLFWFLPFLESWYALWPGFRGGTSSHNLSTYKRYTLKIRKANRVNLNKFLGNFTHARFCTRKRKFFFCVCTLRHLLERTISIA